MTAMCHTDLQTYPPPLDFTCRVPLADLASEVEVRHIALSPAEENELRLRACRLRLAALRRRLEMTRD